MGDFTILGLSGSLRTASLNSAMLRLAAQCAPQGVRVCLFDGMAELPAFNPDLNVDTLAPVARLRDAIRSADALLIASPEYAHGVSSVTKTALDWMVADGAVVDKPVALWSPSTRAAHAPAALRATLSVMLARLVEPADLSITIAIRQDDTGDVDPSVFVSMQQAMLQLTSVRARAEPGPPIALRDLRG